jgi:hypothetical protein
VLDWQIRAKRRGLLILLPAGGRRMLFKNSERELKPHLLMRLTGLNRFGWGYMVK